jgi:hypothetical protein
MLAVTVVEEVQRLLNQGLSQREVARKVGVSRGTVHAIASGKRLPLDPRRPHSADEPMEFPDGPTQRCPQCGSRVKMPCLACRVRALQERQRLRGRTQDDRRCLAASNPIAREGRLPGVGRPFESRNPAWPMSRPQTSRS